MWFGQRYSKEELTEKAPPISVSKDWYGLSRTFSYNNRVGKEEQLRGDHCWQLVGHLPSSHSLSYSSLGSIAALGTKVCKWCACVCEETV